MFTSFRISALQLVVFMEPACLHQLWLLVIASSRIFSMPMIGSCHFLTEKDTLSLREPNLCACATTQSLTTTYEAEAALCVDI
jgi:hypothetical protein